MEFEEAMKLAKEFISCDCDACEETRRVTVDAFIHKKNMKLPCPTMCSKENKKGGEE